MAHLVITSPRALIPPAQIAIAPPPRPCEYDNSQTSVVFTIACVDPLDHQARAISREASIGEQSSPMARRRWPRLRLRMPDLLEALAGLRDARGVSAAPLDRAAADLGWRQFRAAPEQDIRGMAMLGKAFFLGFVAMQLTLVLLVAPAATAGSICLDRARGTLTHMLVTDLSSAEIVLGKLAARLVPVLGLLACALPLMEILALVGGLDPNALLGAFVVALGIAVLGSSLALFFSLWVGKTHEAILATYAVWGLWLLWTPIIIDCRGSVSPGVFLSASALGQSVLAGIRSVSGTEIGRVARLRIVPRGYAGPLGDVGGHGSFPAARDRHPRFRQTPAVAIRARAVRRALRPGPPLARAVAGLEPGFLAGMASQQAVAPVAGDRRALFRARHDLQLDHGRFRGHDGRALGSTRSR